MTCQLSLLSLSECAIQIARASGHHANNSKLHPIAKLFVRQKPKRGSKLNAELNLATIGLFDDFIFDCSLLHFQILRESNSKRRVVSAISPLTTSGRSSVIPVIRPINLRGARQYSGMVKGREYYFMLATTSYDIRIAKEQSRADLLTRG